MFPVVVTVLLSSVWAVASGNTTQPATASVVTPPPTQTSVISASVVTTPPTQTSVISNLFSNTTLRKCNCGAGEVLDGSTCRRKPTLVAVLETITYTSLDLETSKFSSVTVGKPQCPQSNLLVFLDQNNPLHILPSGKLLWHSDVLTDYCLEHVLQDGDQTLLETYVCLPPPPVPQCCPPGHILGPDNSCIAHNLQKFAPPINLNDEFLQWASVDGYVKNITCEGVSVARRLKMNMEGRLLYSSLHAVLMWQPSAESSIILMEQKDYCVGVELDDESNDPIYVARVCYVDPLLHHKHACTNNTCIRKCCPENQLFYDGNCLGIQSEEEIWEPIFHFSHNLSAGVAPKENLMIIDGFPLCKSYFQLNPDTDQKEESFLLTDGSLHVPTYQTNYQPTHYCLDYFVDETGAIINGTIICHPEEVESTCRWNVILILVLLGVSCVFLAGTMAVYLGVPELRERTNGRCLISMVSAMLTAYISIICNRLIREQSNTQCIIVAFVGHVSSLATFFWLNVMCYDMWSTLRSSRQQHHSMKRFLLYSAYAWGCPLVVGVAAVVIDSQETSNLIRPRFTESTCWFYGNAEYWLYLNGINCILLLVNIFFFVHVALTLSKKLQQRRMVFETSTSRSSNTTKSREQAWLYAKLFIVMGVVWIAEVLSSVHHRNTCTYWVVTDIINGLQGVFIFIVAVCNKDNMKKIQAAWRPRIENVQKTVTTLRGKTISNKDKRTTDLSVATSDASRKTSVTSLPRKISVASSIFFPNSSKAKRATELSDTSEASRKFSTVSNVEVIPMTTMDE